jgi:hypothetical protein
VEHEDGLNFCRALMELDERHHVRASFQIVPETAIPFRMRSSMRSSPRL